MLALSTALISRLLPRLSGEPPRQEGLRTWIHSGSFYPGVGAQLGDLRLQSVALSEVVPFISYDFERFAFSSLESARFTTEPNGVKALGWPLTRLYYSAFFGAHAIMRATGSAVLRIETEQAVRLTQLAAAYQLGITISSGTYRFTLIQGPNGEIDGELRKLPDIGGAHDQFWRAFYEFMQSVSTEVAQNKEPEATMVAIESSELCDILRSNGFNGGTWLSSVRNQLTYQHKYGVWFPFPKSDAKIVDYLRRLSPRDSATIRRDYDTRKDPLLAFAACCHLISSLNNEVANGLCRRPGTIRFKQLLSQLQKPHFTP